MPRLFQETPAQPSSRSPPQPSVPADDLDGPLCALSLYLDAADRASQAIDIDRDVLSQALQGAKEQVADLARKTAAACQQGR